MFLYNKSTVTGHVKSWSQYKVDNINRDQIEAASVVVEQVYSNSISIR